MIIEILFPCVHSWKKDLPALPVILRYMKTYGVTQIINTEVRRLCVGVFLAEWER